MQKELTDGNRHSSARIHFCLLKIIQLFASHIIDSIPNKVAEVSLVIRLTYALLENVSNT